MIDDIDIDALTAHFKTCDRKTQREILNGTFNAYMKRMNLHSKLSRIYTGGEQ
jgi:hypothetical protein